MLNAPLTSRGSFLVCGVVTAELLTRFNLGQWLVLIVVLSLIEARIERGRIYKP